MNVSKLPKLSSTSFFKLDGVHPFYEQKEGNSFYTSLCLVQFIEIFYSGRSRCAYSQVQHCGPAAYPFSHGCTLTAIILTTLCMKATEDAELARFLTLINLIGCETEMIRC